MMAPTDNDTLLYSWENAATGDLYEAELEFEQAAQLQRGAVAGYGLVQRWSLDDRIAALRARQDQIRERMRDLATQYPQLLQGRTAP